MGTMTTNSDILKIILVTGMSGAGRGSALACFEDMGFEVFDNVPLSLFKVFMKQEIDRKGRQKNQPSLLKMLGAAVEKEEEFSGKPIVVGIDARTRGFTSADIKEFIAKEKNDVDTDVKILFLDCDDSVLIKRYKETRRSHPVSRDMSLNDCILMEREKLADIKEMSDVILDTSDFNLGELKNMLGVYFGDETSSEMPILITSFSFKKGIPREADLVFDVRFLKNPYYVEELREHTGIDEDVADFVASDKHFQPFYDSLINLIEPLLPLYKKEGKNSLNIAIGCTGGRHRSVFVASKLAKYLEKNRKRINLKHRELEKLGLL